VRRRYFLIIALMISIGGCGSTPEETNFFQSIVDAAASQQSVAHEQGASSKTIINGEI